MTQVIKKPTMFPAFPTLFDDFFTKDFFDWNDKNFAQVGSTLPSVNLKETDKKFHIELAAPGMKKDDFKVEVINGMLTITSEKKVENEEKDKEGNYLRKEFCYESFYRSFSMPENVKEDTVSAAYKDGILNISIEKKAPKAVVKPKAIEVK
ncbi:MAG: Hsp20/alpha crystallin family protein [Saprospiraceae bacterium]